MKWMDESGIKISNPEEIVYSKKHGYWGIKDSDGKKGKNRFVLDYKTSKGIYSPMRYQVSAYLFGSEEMNKYKYDGYWILRFDKETGNFEPLFVDRKEAKEDFEAFLGAFAVKRREKELNTYDGSK